MKKAFPFQEKRLFSLSMLDLPRPEKFPFMVVVIALPTARFSSYLMIFALIEIWSFSSRASRSLPPIFGKMFLTEMMESPPPL